MLWRIKRIQLIALLISFVPIVSTFLRFMTNDLSANPIEHLIRSSGDTAILFLFFTLICTPFSNLLRIQSISSIRSILGFSSLIYALAHFLLFAGLDYGFDLELLIPQFTSRPFIVFGAIALLFLVTIQVTAQYRAGKIINGFFRIIIGYLVFLATSLVLVHVFLASKGNYIQPILYSIIFLVTILLKIPWVSGKLSFSSTIFQSIDQFLLSPVHRKQ